MNTQCLNTRVLNTHSLKFIRPKSLLVFLALTTAIPASGLAGPLSLATNALEVVTGVEPNVMILNDDSASMDFGIMTDEANGFLHMTGDTSWPYGYAHPAPGASGSAPAINTYRYFDTSPYLDVSWSNLPSQEYLASIGITAPQQGVWRARNNNYNKVYYNPNVTYTPWYGLDSGGTAFADASSTAARYNPYNSGGGTLDLTTNLSDFYTGCPLGLSECNTAKVAKLVSGSTDLTYIVLATGFYPARYYVWTDDSGGNANGVVDADDTHTLVEIKSTTATYTGRLAYTEASGKGRSDCTDNGDGTATCSYTQEIQNFANWFSYYRKRDLTAKAAISAAVKPTESARIGFATINSRILNKAGAGTNNIRVASMNVSTDSGNKKALLDKVFSAFPAGATPLRQALVDTGEYFACNANDIFDSAGSTNCPIEAAPAGQCQQNYTILMTDGYWDNWFGDSANKGATVAFGNPKWLKRSVLL